MMKDLTGGASSGDGYLTADELKAHVENLSDERTRVARNGSSTWYLDMQINDARKLYSDIVSAGVSAVQYLPDDLLNLPLHLRKRASELLAHDDTTMLGYIDQFVIDHARGRYQALTAYTPGSMSAKDKALAEIGELAGVLGLM